MESPSSLETPQPDASASLVPQECTNNKENAAPPSPVEREHDELRHRPRDNARGGSLGAGEVSGQGVALSRTSHPPLITLSSGAPGLGWGCEPR